MTKKKTIFDYLFFFIKRRNKASVLKNSNDAIDLFTKAINKLRLNNDLADELISKNVKSIEGLSADNDQLDAAKTKNQNIIANIEKMLA